MAEFIAMGGYAQFVWSAFGLWCVCLVFTFVSARRKFRSSLEHAAVAAARQQHRHKIRQSGMNHEGKVSEI